MNRKNKYLTVFKPATLAVTLAALGNLAFSVSAQGSSNVSLDTSQVNYPREWFDRFAPNSAADILAVIPSFSVQSDDAERGLGRENENVLINGQPTKGKGTSALDLLSRIPADAVSHVEVADAANFELSGITGTVANVILNQKRIQASLEWSPEYRPYADPRYTNGAAFVSGELDTITYTFGIKNGGSREGDEVTETIRDQSQNVISRNEGTIKTRRDQPTLSLDLTKVLSENHRGGVSLVYGQGTKLREVEFTRRGEQDIQEFFTSTDEDWTTYSTTLRLDGDLGQYSYELLAYHTAKSLSSDNESSLLPQGEQLGSANRFNFDRDTEESIFQATLLRGDASQFWEISAEFARNELDTKAQSGSGQSIATTVVTPNLDSSGSVTENRAQLMLSGRTQVGRVTFDGAFGAEYSELTAVSLDQSTNDFFRPKGAVSASIALDKNRQLRAAIERSVGQLNFNDFLGAQNLRFNQTTQTNVELKPNQAWDALIEFDNRFNTASSHTIGLKYSAIEDIVDRLIINGQDAIGNVGDGSRVTLYSNLSWRPEHPNFKQWQLNLTNSWSHTELDDPITGEERPFSNNEEWRNVIEVFYELKAQPITLGMKVEEWRNFDNYLANEQSSFGPDKPQLEVYLNHTDFFGANLTAKLVNLLDQPLVREREIYSGLRNSAEPAITELIEGQYGPFIHLSIQQTF